MTRLSWLVIKPHWLCCIVACILTSVLIGQLSTHKGAGSGSVNVSLRRITSADGWAEVEMGFGSGLSFTAKGFRNLTKRIFTNVSGIVTSTDRGLTLGFVSSKCQLYVCLFLSLSNGVIYSAGASTGQKYGWLPNLQGSRTQFDEYDDSQGHY